MEILNQQLIVLLGESLLMDSVEAGLANEQSLSVLRMRSAVPELARRLHALDPELIMFDLDATNLNSVLSYMRLQPGVPILGLDVNSNQVISLTCEHRPAGTMAQLRDVIDQFTVDVRPDLKTLFRMSTVTPQAVKS